MDSAPTATPFDPAGVRTLIVGDNAFERRLVHDLLIALGVREIILAEDAIAAFAQLSLRKPHLVIADAEMRPFSGFMLARELRGAAIAARNVPLVLFTAEASPDFAAAARDAGAHEVIAKPVSADALRACLQAAMLHPREFSPTPQRRGHDRRLRHLDHDAPLRRRSDHEPRVVLERIARTQMLAAIDEARTLVQRWADVGDTTLIEGARAAIERASDAAWTGGGDPALTQALTGALRLTEAAIMGRADPDIVAVSLAAARAVLSAGPARRAMREALAEAVSDAADSRRSA